MAKKKRLTSKRLDAGVRTTVKKVLSTPKFGNFKNLKP